MQQETKKIPGTVTRGFTLVELITATVVLAALVLIFGRAVTASKELISSASTAQKYYNIGSTLSNQLDKDMASVPSYGFIKVDSNDLMFLSMGDFQCFDSSGNIETDGSGNPLRTNVACTHYHYGSGNLYRYVHPMYKYSIGGVTKEAESPFNKTLGEIKDELSSGTFNFSALLTASTSKMGSVTVPPTTLDELEELSHVIITDTVLSTWTGFQTVFPEGSTQAATTSGTWTCNGEVSSGSPLWPGAVRLTCEIEINDPPDPEDPPKPIEIYTAVSQ